MAYIRMNNYSLYSYSHFMNTSTGHIHVPLFIWSPSYNARYTLSNETPSHHPKPMTTLLITPRQRHTLLVHDRRRARMVQRLIIPPHPYIINQLSDPFRTMRRVVQARRLGINIRRPPLHRERKLPPRIQTVLVVESFRVPDDAAPVAHPFEVRAKHRLREVLVPKPGAVGEGVVLGDERGVVAERWDPGAQHGFVDAVVKSGFLGRCAADGMGEGVHAQRGDEVNKGERAGEDGQEDGQEIGRSCLRPLCVILFGEIV